MASSSSQPNSDELAQQPRYIPELPVSLQHYWRQSCLTPAMAHGEVLLSLPQVPFETSSSRQLASSALPGIWYGTDQVAPVDAVPNTLRHSGKVTSVFGTLQRAGVVTSSSGVLNRETNSVQPAEKFNVQPPLLNRWYKFSGVNSTVPLGSSESEVIFANCGDIGRFCKLFGYLTHQQSHKCSISCPGYNSVMAFHRLHKGRLHLEIRESNPTYGSEILDVKFCNSRPSESSQDTSTISTYWLNACYDYIGFYEQSNQPEDSPAVICACPDISRFIAFFKFFNIKHLESLASAHKILAGWKKSELEEATFQLPALRAGCPYLVLLLTQENAFHYDLTLLCNASLPVATLQASAYNMEAYDEAILCPDALLDRTKKAMMHMPGKNMAIVLNINLEQELQVIGWYLIKGTKQIGQILFLRAFDKAKRTTIWVGITKKSVIKLSCPHFWYKDNTKLGSNPRKR
ncbi:hypothetical protein B0H11DRAFT_1905829 [Mycena galericulata]|nr:hypothetical protein B0H11DRAFT_1905829 [Mycena galericulata]